VRIAPTYKHIVRPCPVRCGTLNGYHSYYVINVVIVASIIHVMHSVAGFIWDIRESVARDTLSRKLC